MHTTPLGILLAVVLAGMAGLGCGDRQAGDRPNLVLIVIDTLRADRLPFYGHEADTAPFLTSLAARSVVFERAHSTSSWTGPAAASLFTSLYPFQHGVQGTKVVPDEGVVEMQRIPEALRTLPEHLQEAGYRTYAVTDNKNVDETSGFMRGFDRYRNFDYQGAPIVNETVTGWRDTIVSNEPYFLYLHYMDPHLPYHARGLGHDEGRQGDSDADEVRWREDALTRYDSEIRYVDAHIEEVFRAFGWSDNTVVVVTSDHGEEFEEHGGRQHGRSLYAEVLDVPLLLHSPVRWPKGVRVGARVSLVDVAPTLLELAGHPGDPTHVGLSLVDILHGGRETARPLYSELAIEPGLGDKAPGMRVRGVIRGDAKLLDYDDHPDLLFDLASDPAERANALAERASDAAALRRQLDGFMATAPTYEPGRATVALSPKQIEKLRTLGYIK